ncbi:MAG: spore coat protein [Dehalococcoidia bacterium]|nr:MAG: spore coat protein [Dehalococcoidia bacterium]
MKGVILAGGAGSRLKDLCIGLNKHVLPVGKYPMIYYPVFSMINNGITDILIVTGNNDAGQFVDLLGDGTELGCNILYSYQAKPLGIADALRRAENFVGFDENFLTILGDNIFNEKLNVDINNDCEAKIFVTNVKEPQHYGVVNFNEDGSIKDIEEKPIVPKTNTIATGAYIYPSSVFFLINKLSPSERGELEITHLNNMYIDEGLMDYQFLTEPWFDCGESVEEYCNTSYKMKDVQLK